MSDAAADDSSEDEQAEGSSADVQAEGRDGEGSFVGAPAPPRSEEDTGPAEVEAPGFNRGLGHPTWWTSPSDDVKYAEVLHSFGVDPSRSEPEDWIFRTSEFGSVFPHLTVEALFPLVPFFRAIGTSRDGPVARHVKKLKLRHARVEHVQPGRTKRARSSKSSASGDHNDRTTSSRTVSHVWIKTDGMRLYTDESGTVL